MPVFYYEREAVVFICFNDALILFRHEFFDWMWLRFLLY